MPLPLRKDSEGVASTVATMFTLLVILMFLQLTIVAVLPGQEYSAEWATSRAAIDSFERLRLAAQLAVVPGSQFSIPVLLDGPARQPAFRPGQHDLHPNLVQVRPEAVPSHGHPRRPGRHPGHRQLGLDGLERS